MCGRYYIDPDDDMEIQLIIDKIKDKFIDTPEIGALRTGEIFPTNIAPVITKDSPEPMKWGFSRFDGKGHVINARFETAHEKSMFKRSMEERRCILPASCYFEWEKRGSKKQKTQIGADSPLYMAGLYRVEKDFPLPVFVILTMAAWPQISSIHDRMPVLLSAEIREDWLHSRIDSRDILAMPEAELHYKEA